MKQDSHQNRNGQKAIAIIGCGAITESLYLPAFSRSRGMLDRLILVDKDLGRAKKIADRFGVTKTSSDYHELTGSVDGVIVAVPHHLHYAISKYFLAQGIHVLCEKPLTETSSEAQELVAISEETNTTLSVNLTRRLMPSNQKVKELLHAGIIGKVYSITYLDGSEFNWPAATGFYFDSKISKKGVLLDMGAHILDLICWWLGGRPSVDFSENDSFGGCEAVASLGLDYNGIAVRVRLSRLYRLPNSFIINGEYGSIEGMVYDGTKLTLNNEKGSKTLRLGNETGGMAGYGVKLINNFIEVVAGCDRPLIPAHEVLDSIFVLNEAYEKARRFPMPWYNVKV